MEVICGSYESMVFGCTLRKVQQEYDFELSFCDNSHNGNIKAVAVSENGLLATGSSDEYIKLKNLKTRKEVGSISQHDGSISALKFYGKSHLFSASEDGTVIIWKVGSWESLRVLRGHKAPVYDVAVHPTGKIAMSVGKDKTMRMWNLVTGKCAYVTNIKIVADQVIWMPNGERFIVLHDRTMDIHGVQSGKCEHTIKHDNRINAISFIEDGILLASGEGGVVYFYNTEDYSKVYEFPTETVRVKGMHCCVSEEGGAVWLVTGSADGLLKLWTLTSQQGQWSHRLDASKDFGYRITSMAVRVDRKHLEETNTNNNKASTSDSTKSKKRKKKRDVGKEEKKTKKQKVEVEEEQTNEGWEPDDEDDDDEEFLTRKVSASTSSKSDGDLERIDSAERMPKPVNSVEASILDFMKRKKQSREKVNEVETESDDEADKESTGKQSVESSNDEESHESSNEEEGSGEESSSDDSVDRDLMSYVDYLDSIDETDEDDFPKYASRKASKKSLGKVSAKPSKKSLASRKSSISSLAPSKSSKSVGSSKVSKGSPMSRMASKESLPASSKKSKKSRPSSSPSTSQEAGSKKAGLAKKFKDSKKSESRKMSKDSPPEGVHTPSPKKSKKRKMANGNSKQVQESGVKYKLNKQSAKDDGNKLKKCASHPPASRPVHTGKNKRRKAKQ